MRLIKYPLESSIKDSMFAILWSFVPIVNMMLLTICIYELCTDKIQLCKLYKNRN